MRIFLYGEIFGEIETVYEKTKDGNSYFAYADDIFNYDIAD